MTSGKPLHPKESAGLEKSRSFRKKDRTATLTKRVAELEAYPTEVKSSTVTEPNNGKWHSNADGFSRRVRPLVARHDRAVEFASNSTNKKQLNAACDTDTQQDEVMDSEKSELEEQMSNARPVHAPDKRESQDGGKIFGKGEPCRPSAIRS